MNSKQAKNSSIETAEGLKSYIETLKIALKSFFGSNRCIRIYQKT